MGKVVQVAFYRTESGNEPVREWLSAMSIQDKKRIDADILAVEIGWPIGILLVRKLDRDLWEVRTRLPSRISRVFFTILDDSMVLLHGIIKQGQKTPKGDLNLARKRRNEAYGGRNDEK